MMTQYEVREALRTLGLRLIDAAPIFGLTSGAVGHWVSGRRQIPPRHERTLRRLLAGDDSIPGELSMSSCERTCMKTTVELEFEDFIILLRAAGQRAEDDAAKEPGGFIETRPVWVGCKMGPAHAPERTIVAVFETPLCRYVYGESLAEEGSSDSNAVEQLAKRIFQDLDDKGDILRPLTVRTIRW